MRALIVTRLSKDDPASMSVQDQLKVCRTYCADRQYEVVGEVIDKDQSGGKPPLTRPELGAALSAPDQQDILVVYRFDRIYRSAPEQTKFEEWARDHEILVESATEPNDQMSREVRGMVGQWELDAIKARNTASADRLIRAGRYRGGNPPLGYRAVKDGNEWRYVHDPVLTPLTQSIVQRVIDGTPVGRIVKDLNDRGVPTPQDYHAVQAGKEPKDRKWATGNLIRQLESETLLGYAMRSDPEVDKHGRVKTYRDNKGRTKKVFGPKKVIYGEDGRPIQRSEPIISQADFQRLQEALKVRRGTSPKRRMSAVALLLQVIFCGVCDRPMYRLYWSGRSRTYYRCASAAYQSTCGNRSVRLEEMDDMVSRFLLAILGDRPHVVREYVPGSDNSNELEEVNAQLDAITSSLRFLRGPQLEGAQRDLEALYGRQGELEGQPRVPAGYRYTMSGKTFREHWESLNEVEKNEYLRELGVRVTFTHPKSEDGPRKIDVEFGDMLRMVAAVDPDFAQNLDRHGEDFRRYINENLTEED